MKLPMAVRLSYARRMTAPRGSGVPRTKSLHTTHRGGDGAAPGGRAVDISLYSWKYGGGVVDAVWSLSLTGWLGPGRRLVCVRRQCGCLLRVALDLREHCLHFMPLPAQRDEANVIKQVDVIQRVGVDWCAVFAMQRPLLSWAESGLPRRSYDLPGFFKPRSARICVSKVINDCVRRSLRWRRSTLAPAPAPARSAPGALARVALPVVGPV